MGTREMRIEVIDAATAAMYRRMTPLERVMRGLGACAFARGVIRASVKAKHPEWSEEAVEREVARRFAGA